MDQIDTNVFSRVGSGSTALNPARNNFFPIDFSSAFRCFCVPQTSRFRATSRTNPRETEKPQWKVNRFEERTFDRGKITCKVNRGFGFYSRLQWEFEVGVAAKVRSAQPIMGGHWILSCRRALLFLKHQTQGTKGPSRNGPVKRQGRHATKSAHRSSGPRRMARS